MTKMLYFFGCALAMLAGQSVRADVEVAFFESAPKDRFVVTNTGACGLKDLVLKIDLAPSGGRLIFDTTATGAGVEVFQPFEVREGGIALISTAGVQDGDAGLALSIDSLPPGASVSFTIDVDDTLPESELGKIRVSGSEIKGGLVEISSAEQTPATGVFASDSKAIVSLPPCS